MSSPVPKILWETTGTFESHNTLNKMYKAIPLVVIKEALAQGARDLESLQKFMYKHEKQTTINNVEARKRSTAALRGWELTPRTKQDSRNHKDFFK